MVYKWFLHNDYDSHDCTYVILEIEAGKVPLLEFLSLQLPAVVLNFNVKIKVKETFSSVGKTVTSTISLLMNDHST
jgi:hypothetical protein